MANIIASNLSTVFCPEPINAWASGPEPAGTGIKCAVKNLYEGPESQPGCITWLDTCPAGPEDKPVESMETASYALLVRNMKSRDNSKKLWMIGSIVVQSPFLKSALNPVLDGYPGITTGLRRLEFSAPFQPFMHRWDKLANVTEEEQNPETKEHLELFYWTLYGELKDTIAAKMDLLSHNVITFDLV